MNLTQSIKLMIREWFVDGLRWWFSAKGSAWLSVIAVSLAGSLLVTAQEPDAAAQNNPTAADVLSQLSDLVQSTDSPQPEDMVAPNDLAPTNGLPQADVSATGGDRTAKVNRFDNAGRSDNNSRYQGSSRSQSDDRRSRGRRSRSRFDQSGGSGSAGDYSRGSDGTNNGPITLDYSSFKVIVDRNIFDPNRTPRGSVPLHNFSKPKSFDSLTLVGTMTYEKGTFAFFDGTSSEYKKALKLADAIAGYKVTNIAPNGVKLASGTNELDLSVGAQLRREENGPWQLAGQSTTYAATPTSTNATATTSTGSNAASSSAESDIIKRLMQKREKE
jgi:hypothetical protein